MMMTPTPAHQSKLRVQPLDALPAALLAVPQDDHRRQGAARRHQGDARHQQAQLQAAPAAPIGKVGHPACQGFVN